MKTRYTVVLSMIAGAALGGAAIQGLQAQGKPKAYVVTELETLDAAAAKEFASVAQAAQKDAGGRSLRTAGGKVVSLEGAPVPNRVGLTEWDSLEQAQAFYKSKAKSDDRAANALTAMLGNQGTRLSDDVRQVECWFSHLICSTQLLALATRAILPLLILAAAEACH